MRDLSVEEHGRVLREGGEILGQLFTSNITLDLLC